MEKMKRDAKADLEVCAITNAQFAREALPHWIKRAMEAEEALKKCVKPLYNWCNNGCATPVGHCSDCDYDKIILEFGSEPCDK